MHVYLYAHADPVSGWDPSGNVTLNDVMLAVWNVGIQAGLAVARVSPAAAAAGKTLATVASYSLSALNLYWFATDQHFREFVVATGGTGVLVADAGKLLELGQGLVKLTRSAVQAAGLLRAGGAPNLQLSNLGGHNAEVTLLGKDGKLLSRWTETSGGQTPEQLAMGFPRGSLASHTEVKAVHRIHLATGETMIIRGTLPPCPSCKGVMRGATANSGVRIEYHYPQPSRADGEELVIEIWENGQKVSGSGS